MPKKEKRKAKIKRLKRELREAELRHIEGDVWRDDPNRHKGGVPSPGWSGPAAGLRTQWWGDEPDA